MKIAKELKKTSDAFNKVKENIVLEKYYDKCIDSAKEAANKGLYCALVKLDNNDDYLNLRGLKTKLESEEFRVEHGFGNIVVISWGA